MKENVILYLEGTGWILSLIGFEETAIFLDQGCMWTRNGKVNLYKEATIYEIIINLVKNSDERYGNAI